MDRIVTFLLYKPDKVNFTACNHKLYFRFYIRILNKINGMNLLNRKKATILYSFPKKREISCVEKEKIILKFSFFCFPYYLLRILFHMD